MLLLLFVFKQKTAYEMRISDWSSDVCSSDLFSVDIRNEGKFEPVKTRLGVPAAQHSCHTAQVRGYFVEGHVPVEDIKRLLVEKPDARGLALAGMPMGSPDRKSVV